MTTKRFLVLGVLALSLATAACDGLNRAMTSHTGVVARAAGLELTVDQAAGLLAQNERLAAEPEVVGAVANLWVDYVLLASAASQDSTLRSVDVGPLIDSILEQQVFIWEASFDLLRSYVSQFQAGTWPSPGPAEPSTGEASRCE